MSEPLMTQPSDFDHPAEGYIVIAPLSEESKERIADIQSRYAELFGEKALWLPKEDQLHITFSHIITPNAEYTEDRSSLFARLQPQASAALSAAVRPPLAVACHFSTVEAFPSAVILKATDDGTYDKLRRRFIENFQPPEGTRMPPEIIHTTLLRFKEPVNLAEIQKLTEEIMEDFEPFDELTTSLQMIREKKIFVQDHEVLEEFPPATNS